MRGNLTDQDLTNYALNELDPHERMYVESMLAVSPECRNDVYEMLEMGQMLEAGFERESGRVSAMLTTEQRATLTKPRRRRIALSLIHRAAATMAVAACAAFALVNPRLWHNDSARTVAQVSSQMIQNVTQAVAPDTDKVDISSFVNLEAISEDSSDWLQAASDALPQPAVVCTPPSWLENSSFSDLH